MPGTFPPADWTHLRWTEIAAADPSRWIAVLPLAATEQHGPHLPLGTDVLIAQAYLAELRRFVPTTLPVTVLPVQPIGISTEHLAFPGTLTLPPDVAIKSWMAIGESLARAGLRKLVIVTSHGDNSAAMAIVAQELRAHHGMLVVTTSWGRLSGAETMFAADEVLHGIHGGAIETSIMLARHKSLVRQEAIAHFVPSSVGMQTAFTRLSTQRPAPLAWQAQDLHAGGAIGDATAATAELGERLLAGGARAFSELLEDVDLFDLALLGNAPQSQT
jgi:creatinine amidohydrolase